MLLIEYTNSLGSSLQREFEWYADSADINIKDSPGEKKIRSKKRQQGILNEIKAANVKLSELIERQNEQIFRLEACLLNYGVSPSEILYYINKGKSGIEYDIKNYICENIFQVPENFASMVDWKDQEQKMMAHLNAELDKIAEKKTKPEPIAIRFVSKPSMDWSKVKTKNQTWNKNKN